MKVLLVIAAPFLTRESTKSGCLGAGYFLMDCFTLGHQSQIWVSMSFTLLLRNPNTLGALKWRAECGHQVECWTLNLRRQSDNGSLELTMWVVHSGSLVCCFACCCSLLHIVVRCCMSKKVQGLTVGTACFPRFTVGEFGACQMCARERSTFMFCVAHQWL